MKRFDTVRPHLNGYGRCTRKQRLITNKNSTP